MTATNILLFLILLTLLVINGRMGSALRTVTKNQCEIAEELHDDLKEIRREIQALKR